jgi:hypothetical protein
MNRIAAEPLKRNAFHIRSDIIYREANPVMVVQRRLTIAAAALAFVLAVYGIAKYYSPVLVLYVVEQSLIQKAPVGIEPSQMRERLHRFLATDSDKDKRMEKMLRISGYLEKVQYLTPEELNELLPVEQPPSVPAV